MPTIAVYNIKGGVGKTATSVNLAYLASRRGLRTLLWDLDPQGAASHYLRVDDGADTSSRRLLNKKKGLAGAIRGSDYANLDVIPSNLKLRSLELAVNEFKKPTRRLTKVLAPLLDDYDIVFLDCAPNLSLVTDNIFAMADWLLIPVIPTHLSVRGYQQLKTYSQQQKLATTHLLPFFSMVDRRRRLHLELATDFAETYPEVLPTYVPYTSQVERMGERRAPVLEFAPRSPGGQAFVALWEALAARIGLNTDRDR